MKIKLSKACCYILTAGILSFFNDALLAQEKTFGTLEGLVLNVITDLPLENAVVKLTSSEKSDVTDKNGLFIVKNISFGKHTIVIEHLGFKSAELTIDITQENTTGLIVHLSPIAIELSNVIITGEHTDNKFDDMNEFINVLKGKELQREMGMTLANTLKNETGLAIRSMGPAPSRPVIRGLGNDRISINEDGFQSIDLSSTSPDHSVSIEPFNIERIEVIRGPKVLLNNSSTMGGVVNIIKNEIPANIPAAFTGNIGIYGESVNEGYLGSFAGMIPLNNFAFTTEITARKTSDISTPIATLKNSDIKTHNYSFGASNIYSWGLTGFSIREYQSDYGVPGGFVGAHPNGVDINMLKRQFNLKSIFNFGSDHFENLEFNFSRDYYKHTEYERADIIGAQFIVYNYHTSLNLKNRHIGIFDNGESGISFDLRDYNIGGYVFTPPTISNKFAAYSFQTFEWDDLAFETAMRLSYDLLRPDNKQISEREQKPERDFFNVSFSISSLYSLNKSFSVGLNLNKTSRVPTIEELYSEGPHLAAYSYEIGNKDLRSENGYGLELFSFYKENNNLFSLTLYRNDFAYYIIPRNSGRINSQTLLPIYQTEGVGAIFYGFESSLEFDLLNNLRVLNSISYTYGEFKENGAPLPQIPPLKNIFQIISTFQKLSLGATLEMVSAQKRVDEFEEPTAGYAVLHAFMQYHFQTGRFLHSLSFNTENIFNKEYRNHLSRVKVIMPEAGRNFKLTYRLYF